MKSHTVELKKYDSPFFSLTFEYDGDQRRGSSAPQTSHPPTVDLESMQRTWFYRRDVCEANLHALHSIYHDDSWGTLGHDAITLVPKDVLVHEQPDV